MKSVFPFIAIFLATHCDGQFLYDSIPISQLRALSVAPYRDAKYATVYVNPQKLFRQTQFPGVIKNLLAGKNKITDSLWIVEEFADECFNCQSFRTKILYKDTLYTIKTASYGSPNYVISKTEFSRHQNDSDFITTHHEIFEVKQRISKNKSWTSESLKYGEDGCDDGSHTFLTLISSNRICMSVYVRCWYDWYGKSID